MASHPLATGAIDEPHAIEQPSPTGDEGIFCPVCAYNLTGVVSGRCPECGSMFDRDALHEAQRDRRVTLMSWDDPADLPAFVRWRRTLRTCLLDAQRFAFAFSVQPPESRAGRFAILVMFIAWLPAVGLGMLIEGGALGVAWPTSSIAPSTVVLFTSLVVTLTVLFTYLGAVWLTAGLFWLLFPHWDGGHHFRPWLAIAQYATAHYLLWPAAGPLFLLLVLFPGLPIGMAYGAAMFVAWAACGMLNAFTLQAVVAHRCRQRRVKGLAALALMLPALAPFSAMGIAFVLASLMTMLF